MSATDAAKPDAPATPGLARRLWASPVLRKNLGAGAGLVAVVILFSILLAATRGIDVASKAQIYDLIDALVTREHPPKAVIMVSSYLPELLGVCDRIAVMCRGRLGPARPAAEWTEQSLVHEAAA